MVVNGPARLCSKTDDSEAKEPATRPDDSCVAFAQQSRGNAGVHLFGYGGSNFDAPCHCKQHRLAVDAVRRDGDEGQTRPPRDNFQSSAVLEGVQRDDQLQRLVGLKLTRGPVSAGAFWRSSREAGRAMIAVKAACRAPRSSARVLFPLRLALCFPSGSMKLSERLELPGPREVAALHCECGTGASLLAMNCASQREGA